MGFPEIKSCLICEEMRPEQGGKATILGFFGIAPDVEIFLKEWGTPIKVTFFLLAGQGEGSFDLKPSIIDPQGRPIIEAPPLKVSFQPTHKRTFLTLGLSNINFRTEGEQLLKLYVDGREKYSVKFSVLREPTAEAELKT